jgi:uncharacterized protein YndB with AHSA1/START domain
MTDHIIEKTTILAAPPDRVWAYLTDPDLLALWFYRPDAPLSEGQPFTMPGADGAPLVWGEVSRAIKPRTLIYSFTARPMNGAMTEVTWSLTPVEAGTRLRLIHSGFPPGPEAFGLLTDFDGGWDNHLKRMRDIAQ